MDKAEIKKIEISIGKRVIELTMNEAEEMHMVLRSIFKQMNELTIPGPYPAYPYVYWYGGDRAWKITFRDDTGTLSADLFSSSTTNDEDK